MPCASQGLNRQTLDLLKVADPADGAVVMTFPAETDMAEVNRVLREIAGATYEVSLNGQEAQLAFTPLTLRDERRRILRQALEIIRRRLDETGTREPTVRLQGEERILVQIPGLRDPERVKALLGRTARLTFHMTDESAGGDQAAAGFVRTSPPRGRHGGCLAADFCFGRTSHQRPSDLSRRSPRGCLRV